MPDPDPNDKTKQDPPPAGITEEDVGRIVNSAVTSQLKRLLPTAIGEAMGGLKLDEQIAAAIAKVSPPPPDDPKDKGKGTKTDLEKRLEEMATKLETSEKRASDAEKLRLETEQARRLDAGTTAFRSALQAKLRPELLDVAVSHWGATQQRLKLAEDGSPLLRVKRAPYKGAPEQDEDLPLDQAIPILLAAEEAKPFLPAPAPLPGRGGGAPRSSVTDGLTRFDTPANTDEERAQRAATREQEIKTRLGL